MGRHQVTAECHSFTHQSLIHSTNVNQPEMTDSSPGYLHQCPLLKTLICFFNHTPCQSCQRNSGDKSSLSRQQASSGLRYFIKMLEAAREAHSNRRVSVSSQVPPLSPPNTASPWPRQLDVHLHMAPCCHFPDFL